MLFSNRAIFQSTANSSPKINFKSNADISTAIGYDDQKSSPYYIVSPDRGVLETSVDNAALQGGYGFCGSVTFKYQTAANYVWGNTFWNDANVERIRVDGRWNTGAGNLYQLELFMVDGVLAATDTGLGHYLPVTPCRTKTGHKFGMTTEYGGFLGMWFDYTWDELADRWLTFTFSHANPGILGNFAHDTSKYGTANGTKQIRYCLWDARTGELLGTTDRYDAGNLYDAQYSGGEITARTWSFDIEFGNAPIIDFETNNNARNEYDGEMIKVSSSWRAVGSTVWDPLVVGLDAVGDQLPEYIGGKRALMNHSITAADGYFIYGYRPAICSVTGGVTGTFGDNALPNAITISDNITYPISNDHA